MAWPTAIAANEQKKDTTCHCRCRLFNVAKTTIVVTLMTTFPTPCHAWIAVPSSIQFSSTWRSQPRFLHRLGASSYSRDRSSSISGLIDYNTDNDNNSNEDTDSLFETLQTTHETLLQLQHLLPRLLDGPPMDLDQLLKSHTEDTQVELVTGSSRSSSILVSGADEWIRLQNTLLYLVVLGPRQAQRFLGDNRMESQQRNQKSQPTTMPTTPIKCRLIVLLSENENKKDKGNLRVRVDWKVSLAATASLSPPPIPSTPLTSILLPGSDLILGNNNNANDKQKNASGGSLQGTSILTLHKGKVARHTVRNLILDGQALDEVGPFLAQARMWMSQLQERSPEWVRSIVFPTAQTLWQQYGKPWILKPDQEPEGGRATTTKKSPAKPPTVNATRQGTLAPIFVRVRKDDTQAAAKKTGKEKAESATPAAKREKTNRSQSASIPKTTTAAAANSRAPSSYLSSNFTLVDIENVSAQSQFPLPGSVLWIRYATLHKSVLHFCNSMVPALASGSGSEIMAKFFETQATLMASDQSTVLIQGGPELSQFYHTLAKVRRQTRGTWTLRGVKLLATTNDDGDINDTPTTLAKVEVRYEVTAGPGSGPAAPTLQGCDVYTLCVQDCEDDHGVTFVPPTIQEIQQERLTVVGNSNPAETTLFMRSLVAGLQSNAIIAQGFRNNNDNNNWLMAVAGGVFNNDEGVDAFSSRIGEMWRGDRASSAAAAKVKPLSDPAAAMVYRFMETLHNDGQALVDTSIANNKNNPPGLAYMSDNVQLMGYLGEPLLRGKGAIQQSLGLLVASLKSGLRSKRLRSERTPTTQVELLPPPHRQDKETEKQKASHPCVQYTLTLHLRLLVLPSFAAAVPPPELSLPSFLGNVNNQDSFPHPDSNGNNVPRGGAGGLPLKITLRANFVLDADSGKVTQQRLLEPLINGQLTPADWLGRCLFRRSGGSDSRSSGASSSLGLPWGLPEMVQWIRSTSSSS